MQLLNNLLFIISCILSLILLICMYIVCIGIYGVLLICVVFRKEIIERMNRVFIDTFKRIKTIINGKLTHRKR
jgi:hypothetical protein